MKSRVILIQTYTSKNAVDVQNPVVGGLEFNFWTVGSFEVATWEKLLFGQHNSGQDFMDSFLLALLDIVQ
jgi:hypothetical protein